MAAIEAGNDESLENDFVSIGQKETIRNIVVLKKGQHLRVAPVHTFTLHAAFASHYVSVFAT